MTATRSSVKFVQNELFFCMDKASMKNAIHASTIQSVIEYKIVSRLMSKSSMLITGSRNGALQIWIYTNISPYQGSEDAIRKISPLTCYSSGMISLDSTGSSKISSANTNDFLDFTGKKIKKKN
jgi:hypothetical protein